MCLSPIRIKNRSNVKYLTPYKKLTEWDSTVYDTCDYRLVPCGQCQECLDASVNHYLDACLYYSNDYYPFFISASVKPDMMSIIDCGHNQYIDYAQSSYVNRFFRSLVSRGIIPSDYHYIGVKERGSESSRPHFHFLLFIPKDFIKSKCRYNNKPDNYYTETWSANYVRKICDCWSVNVGTRKYPKYIPICDYVVKGRKRSFSVDPVSTGTVNKSLYYLLKYQLKQRHTFESDYFVDGTKKGRELSLRVGNKILLSRGFHNWVYTFADSPYCKTDLHPNFKIPWLYLSCNCVYKPISYRSYKKLFNSLDDVFNVKSCMNFDDQSIQHRYQVAENKRLKRERIERNKSREKDVF